MRYLMTILLALTFCKSFGQQQYIITQYMLNGFALNPAYAGSHQTWSFTLMSRYQWIGIEGAPKTQTFTAHGPIKGNSSSGLLAVKDKFGAIELTNVYGTYSYKIPFDQNRKQLSLGFQAGVSYFNVDLSKSTLIDPDDPVLDNRSVSNYLPNFGLGIYYQSEKMYCGLSIPYLNNNRLNQVERNLRNNGKHYYLTMGGIIVLNQVIKYKPSFLVRYVSQIALDVDINSSFIFNDVIWLGATYRLNNSFNFLLELQVTNNFRIGYSYDLIRSELGAATSGSNEFVINYRIKRSNKDFYPRYF